MSLSRYAHTVRYLRPQQIYGRAWFRLHRPRPDARSAPARRTRARDWTLFPWRHPLLLGADIFRFLNVEAPVRVPSDWDTPSALKLWRYNLHYFDDLTARDAAARGAAHRALVARWILENPPAGGTAWEPYPTSLRIVNWIKWSMSGGEARLDDRALDSLAAQTRWLAARLEHHLLGNHLWANAKALVFAGMFFEGPEADRWFDRGTALIARELGEQVLADGGHFELSPMYHATVLEDVLDVINLARVFPERLPPVLVDRLHDAAPRMLRWLRIMTHPDGEIAFFNDAAFGIAAPLAALSQYAAGLGTPADTTPLGTLEPLAASGYVRLSNERAVAICDVGTLGPDHLLAHAHADTLSFELSLDGRRVVVNGGTSTYEGSERQRQRGTAAHNTVVVDGQDSSDVWASFRVARRARISAVTWGHEGSGVWLKASHDGYRRLPGRVTHTRSWRLEPDHLELDDRLEGRWRSARALLHLHPCVRPEELGLSFDPHTDVSRTRSVWCPEFGRSVETVTVSAELSGSALRTRIGLS